MNASNKLRTRGAKKLWEAQTQRRYSLPAGLRPTKRKPKPHPQPQPVATPPPLPVGPKQAWFIDYGVPEHNKVMGAPFPADNSDIPDFDLGEPVDELSRWEQIRAKFEAEWKERQRQRRMKRRREGGMTSAQRKWARRQKRIEKEELEKWWEEEKIKREVKEEVEGSV